MITNPILPGFNPDPCVCRRGDDFYLAVSSFEWLPGVPVYHSRDLKHWELYTHILTEEQVNLRGLPSGKGVWAPCLTWCEADGLFYLVYGVMHSMNARYFDIDNYLITARDIRGPWSEPVYLHSAGFDASLFHDDDGRKWLVSLEWETRDGYEKPGPICLAEYLPEQKRLAGYPQRIWRGGTDRGCLEAPHLLKRNGWYYILCAEGGTGYNHCAAMGRARDVHGPYERDPGNPILTSAPGDPNERHDPDHLKPRYFNPNSILQKSGHASYIETPTGEPYLFHLTARPFVPELRCTLGRETAIQQAVWTEEGWLRLASSGSLAQIKIQEPSLPEAPLPGVPDFDDFDEDTLRLCYYAPRQMSERFADVTARPGFVRLRGQESPTSLHEVSLLARKLTSVYAQVTTKMEFTPEVCQHSAGLILYYDNMNFFYLRKYFSETLGQSALSVLVLENGVRTECPGTRTAVEDVPLCLRLTIRGRQSRFSWSYDGTDWQEIGGALDTTKLSDEYSQYGEFTGTFAGLVCADRLFHRQYADFDSFEYVADESAPVD
ncbi:MAG: glycoside hydrolase family 43 protein [Lachnospiraceae bacterium]|nr:glycoside hydrolase family 43 protein [Lachnospiraceae bacterium]